MQKLIYLGHGHVFPKTSKLAQAIEQQTKLELVDDPFKHPERLVQGNYFEVKWEFESSKNNDQKKDHEKAHDKAHSKKVVITCNSRYSAFHPERIELLEAEVLIEAPEEVLDSIEEIVKKAFTVKDAKRN